MNWGLGLGKICHELGICEVNDLVVVNGLNRSHNDFSQVIADTKGFMELVKRLLSLEFGGSIDRMAAELGCSDREIEIYRLLKNELDSDILVRPDIIYEDGVAKMIELNAGASVGGLFYASLPRLAGGCQEGDVLSSWADKLLLKYPLEGGLVFVEDASSLAVMQKSLHVMTHELELRLSRKIPIIGHSQLKKVNGNLQLGGTVVRYIYPLFNERNVINRPAEYLDILDVVRSGSAKFLLGPEHRIWSNKGILALLWEKASVLAWQDSALIRRYIPETIWVNQSNLRRLLDDKNNYVIKPTNIGGGVGVEIGLDMAMNKWNKVLDSCLSASPKSFVAQRYVRPETLALDMVDKAGTQRHTNCQILWGCCLWRHDYLGSFVRVLPVGAGRKINHISGAHIGPAAKS